MGAILSKAREKKEGFVIVAGGRARYQSRDGIIEESVSESQFDNFLDSFAELQGVRVASHVLREGNEAIVTLGELKHTDEEYQQIVQMLRSSNAEAGEKEAAALVGVKRAEKAETPPLAATVLSARLARASSTEEELAEFEEFEKMVEEAAGANDARIKELLQELRRLLAENARGRERKETSGGEE